jgi:hypothetical protein
MKKQHNNITLITYSCQMYVDFTTIVRTAPKSLHKWFVLKYIRYKNDTPFSIKYN